MGEGEQVVLASDWAGGLADVLRPRLSERSEPALSVHDVALLQTEDGDADLAGSVASTVARPASDSFWIDLNDWQDDDESIADQLAEGIVGDLKRTTM